MTAPTAAPDRPVVRINGRDYPILRVRREPEGAWADLDAGYGLVVLFAGVGSVYRSVLEAPLNGAGMY